MKDRYKVVLGSESAHCCFSHTVVDTSKRLIIGGKEWERNGVPAYETVCETFDEENALRVCSALNQSEDIADKEAKAHQSPCRD